MSVTQHVCDPLRPLEEHLVKKGLVCSIDHDGVIGFHPADAAGARPIQ